MADVTEAINTLNKDIKDGHMHKFVDDLEKDLTQFTIQADAEAIKKRAHDLLVDNHFIPDLKIDDARDGAIDLENSDQKHYSFKASKSDSITIRDPEGKHYQIDAKGAMTEIPVLKGLGLRNADDLMQAANSHQAQVLLAHGKYEQALPLLIKVEAAVPELTHSVKFQLEMSEAMRGAASQNEVLTEHQKKFFDTYFAKENEDPNETQEHRRRRFMTGLSELNEAEKVIKSASVQMTKGLYVLKTTQKELEFERANLDKRANLAQKEKEFEFIRINNEIDLTNKTIDSLNHEIENDRKSLADTAYWQGSSYAQLGPDYRVKAHEKFEYAKANGTNYAKDPEWRLDEQIDATTWWSALKKWF